MGTEHGSQFQQGTFPWGAEVKPRGPSARAELPVARPPTESPRFGETLMEEVCERHNRQAALKQVRANPGSPGSEGRRVHELPAFLKTHWPALNEQLLYGTYHPQGMRRVELPKPGGQGSRKVGIPGVVDRVIQQALLQVLQRQWDSTFADSSSGFRPGRSAHPAVAQAQADLEQGYSTVVDIDLEKFFARVCPDRLLSPRARQIADKRVLKLSRACLPAGRLANGLVTTPREGTPQGSPLSPFLSNVVLDELANPIWLK